MNITNCSMGCLYAEGPIDKCFCKCKGDMHGMLSANRVERAYCSPAVAVRCQNGIEGGECQCACKGLNHGLYRTIEDFGAVRIIDNLQAI